MQIQLIIYKILQSRFHIVDLHLPDRKGLELINGLLSCNFRIPIIILTGYSDLTIAKKESSNWYL
jgi:FixJ family two-component response regulator